MGPRLLNNLPISLRDGSQIRVDADLGPSFSARVIYCLMAAYYSGLSSASPVLQTVALVWNSVIQAYRKPLGLGLRYRKFSSVTMRLVYVILQRYRRRHTH